MNNTATFARIQHYKDGSPDPRTATCDQHRCAAPYSDTAKGDGIDLPVANLVGSDRWLCVVCPRPDADLIGTEVIVTSQSGTYLWGGPADDSAWIRVAFSARFSHSVVTCDVSCIAPADTPLNEKDPRITIEKLPKKRDYQDAGPWLPHIEYLSAWSPTAKKTKRDALAYASRRVAIDDFHGGLLLGKQEDQ